jgi:signal recognition particle subunit SRP54
MNDLLDQMQQIKKMGSMRSIVSMLPGISGKVTDENLDEGDRQLKVIEAMIHSMTKKERANPSIINPSRKRRIAAGSGTTVQDVNRLLKQFDQMKDMMKKMGGFGKKGKKGFGRKMKLPPMNF